MTPDLVFHALGDPTRRTIVERLCESPRTVSALAGPLRISLAAVVQHLRILQASGLVRTEKVGRVRTCRIDPKGLASAESWFAERRSVLARKLDMLGELLTEDEAV